MDLPDLQLGFQVDLVVVIGAVPVFRFLAVLTHHNYWRLDGCQAGKNQVQKNELVLLLIAFSSLVL